MSIYTLMIFDDHGQIKIQHIEGYKKACDSAIVLHEVTQYTVLVGEEVSAINGNGEVFLSVLDLIGDIQGLRIPMHSLAVNYLSKLEEDPIKAKPKPAFTIRGSTGRVFPDSYGHSCSRPNQDPCPRYPVTTIADCAECQFFS